MNPNYPIYVVSKNRADQCLTSRALERMNVPHFIVVETHELDLYRRNYPFATVLALLQEYLDTYDTFDDLGFQKSKGPGAARNFAWDHSILLGAKRHWVMDDNADYFFRFNRNLQIPVASGTILKCAEDFVDRYSNIYIAGLNYDKFCKCEDALPAFILNTRIYSNLLIKNDIPYRWRGRYNEDTDLCLRVLKDGFCTLQFNAFLFGKLTTQKVKGGNTEAFYSKEGTLPKSQMLKDMHPDCVEVVYKFHRWHHYVDYSRFKNNILERRPDYNVPQGTNNYGMKLVRKCE